MTLWFLFFCLFFVLFCLLFLFCLFSFVLFLFLIFLAVSFFSYLPVYISRKHPLRYQYHAGAGSQEPLTNAQISIYVYYTMAFFFIVFLVIVRYVLRFNGTIFSKATKGGNRSLQSERRNLNSALNQMKTTINAGCLQHDDEAQILLRSVSIQPRMPGTFQRWRYRANSATATSVD